LRGFERNGGDFATFTLGDRAAPLTTPSNLYHFSPEALDSAGHRVIAIQQVVLISFPCGKGIDGYEVVLVREPIPIAQRDFDVSESRLIVRIDGPFCAP
jgi:hypothetical protein